MTGPMAVPAEAAAARWRSRPVALATLCTVLFLTFLDTTVVSVALASIRADLHAGVSALQWVVGGYALTFAALMLTFGMVGDEFGRKRVMLAGVAVYCAGAAMSGFSLALGPVLGGAFVGAWSWRGIFWFDVTFGLAALAAAALVLPESADPQAGRVDVGGTVLGASALGALVFAVIDGESAGFTAPGVLALYGVSALAAAAFARWELRSPHPLLDLRFLRVPRFTAPNVIAACCYFATFAIFFFTALYLAEVAGYSGYQVAAIFAPMTVVMIAASLLAGRLTSVIGVRWSMTGG